MRIRTVATLVAALALLVGVAVAVLVATPGVALALQGQRTAVQSAAVQRTRPAVTPSATASAMAGAPAAYSGPLVGARGSRGVTRQQLHAWVLARFPDDSDPAGTETWETQKWLDIRCMARKGFLFDPTNAALEGEPSEADGLTAAQVKAFSVAMWGAPSDAAYDWRTAGCHGRAVHLTGQDDVH